jgi:transposase
MSLQRGKRIVLPLSGRTTITGNIKIVIEGTSVKVHCTAGLKAKTELAASKSNTVALDFGYTEVFTDHEGIHYGAGLGKIITQSSDKRNSKGKVRNKIDALSKTYAASNNPKHQRKARHLRRFNLGKVKLNTNEERTRAAIDCEVNTAFNALIKTKQPEALVVEDLRHTFTFNRPRGANRRLSAWVKGSIQDRADFKSKAEGFCLKQVNPAYGSQTCPCCGYVDSKNRNGDVFECLHCKHRNQADRVAALNYLARESDPDITVYTPYKKVKDILLAGFHRRLESEGAGWPEGTVPGRTLDTVTASPQKVRSRRKSQQVEANILDNLTVTQRAKQNKVDKTIHQ